MADTSIYSAPGPDGLPLPIIDITNPAFRVSAGKGELARMEAQYIAEAARWDRMPRPVVRMIFKVLFRTSRLGRALIDSSGTFLTGMNTYLMKLGPDNLGDWATPLDRRFAAAYPVFSMRLRLQDVATLLAEGIQRMLHPSPPDRPLYLLNIGGGPCPDSLNALLLLRQQAPTLLRGRGVTLHTMDRDDEGAAFARRALASLTAGGAPLEGLDVRFEHSTYDWNRAGELPAGIHRVALSGSAFAISSEGALFEYGSDEAIVSNLRELRPLASADAIFAGSVTRNDGVALVSRRSVRLPTVPRSLDAFTGLAEDGGWRVDRVIEGPFSWNVRLAV